MAQDDFNKLLNGGTQYMVGLNPCTTELFLWDYRKDYTPDGDILHYFKMKVTFGQNAEQKEMDIEISFKQQKDTEYFEMVIAPFDQEGLFQYLRSTDFSRLLHHFANVFSKPITILLLHSGIELICNPLNFMLKTGAPFFLEGRDYGNGSEAKNTVTTYNNVMFFYTYPFFYNWHNGRE